jgi:hypothetical protein
MTLVHEPAKGDLGFVVETKDDSPDYLKNWAQYHDADKRWQANPAHWLSPRLAKLAEMVEGKGMQSFLALVERHWINQRYPLETMDPDFRFHGQLILDECILERARN